MSSKLQTVAGMIAALSDETSTPCTVSQDVVGHLRAQGQILSGLPACPERTAALNSLASCLREIEEAMMELDAFAPGARAFAGRLISAGTARGL